MIVTLTHATLTAPHLTRDGGSAKPFAPSTVGWNQGLRATLCLRGEVEPPHRTRMRTAADNLTRCIIVLCIAVAVTSLSVIALAEAGTSLSSRSLSGGPLLTNPGARYSLDYGTRFHTNPGGKYVFRGQTRKFHTNPGMKYVYPGYTTAPH